MTLTTNPGTGLRANKSPTGIKLANSEFTAQPNEELAAVDVYEVKEQGVVTSVAASADTGFLDKLKWVTGGALDLSSTGSGLKGVLDAVKKGTNMARDVMGTVSRVQNAINRVRNGGIMGALDVAANASRAAGVEIGPAINAVRGAVSGINQGGLSGAARVVDSLTGGNSVTTALNNTNNLRASVERIKNAGSIQGVLSSLDYATGAVSRTVGSLDAASQTDFTKGFNSVLSSPKMNQEAYSKGSLGKITTALGDFTDTLSSSLTNVAARAGISAGLAVVAAETGNNQVYSLLRQNGLDERSSFVAGSAIGNYSLSTGNLSLLKNIASDEVGSSAITSIPNVVATMAGAVKQPSTPMPLKQVFDDLQELAEITGQRWDTAVRSGKEMLSTAATQANEYMTSVLIAKADDDHFKNRTGVTTVDLTAHMTDAQALAAAQVAQSLYVA